MLDTDFWRKYFRVYDILNKVIPYQELLQEELCATEWCTILSSALEALEQKDKIWIYPEGKRTKDGNLQPGKRGVAFLHQQTKAPIVPVAISGSFQLFSPKNIFRRRKLKIKIGQPIDSLGNVSLEEGTDIVMNKIADILI